MPTPPMREVNVIVTGTASELRVLMLPVHRIRSVSAKLPDHSLPCSRTLNPLLPLSVKATVFPCSVFALKPLDIVVPSGPTALINNSSATDNDARDVIKITFAKELCTASIASSGKIFNPSLMTLLRKRIAIRKNTYFLDLDSNLHEYVVNCKENLESLLRNGKAQRSIYH